MATTRSEFVTYTNRIFKRDDKTQETLDALNDVIKDATARHSFQVLRRQAYVPTVSGHEDYPLPDDLLHFHHPIRLLEGSGTNSSGWPIRHIDKDTYDYYEPNPNRSSPSTGTPWAYCIWQNALLLTDIPGSQGYIIEINYGKKPTLPSADSSTAHPFGVEWDETVRWGVLARLFEGLGLDDEAQKWGAFYELGKPVVSGGVIQGYLGGLQGLIEKDRNSNAAPQFVDYNIL